METIDPLTRKIVALHRRKALEKQIITTTLASAMLKKLSNSKKQSRAETRK